MSRRRPEKRPPTPTESENEVEPMLPVGAEVEVRSDDPGFANSFYEATVAGHPISNGTRCYTLAYSTLLADDGAPLEETADAAHVRPRPPGAPRRQFGVHEMVEAFHNDGWWAGVVVSAVHPPPPVAPVYEVTFPTSRETMEFEETALRPHRVFQDGRWLPAAEVDNGGPLFSEGNQVEVSRSEKNFGESWSPATVLKVIGAYFLVQYIHIEKNGELATEVVGSGYIRPACIITRMASRYRFSLSSHVEVFHQGSWWPGVIVQVLRSGINKKYVVKLENHETDIEDLNCAGLLTVQNAQLRPRYCWDGKKWARYFEEKPAKELQLSAQKRPISAAVALTDEGDGSCMEKKLKADVVSESISPLMSVPEKCEINHMSCSHPKETMEQGNAVSALVSQLSFPSLPSVTALGHLGPSSLAPSYHLEQSSQMISIPSRPRAPFLGTRSLNSDWSKIVLTDHDKQSTVGTGTAAAMTEYMIGYAAPEEDSSIVSPATLDATVPSPSPLQLALKSGVIETHTEVFSDSSQSTEKSTVTRVSSVAMDNCNETEPGNTLAMIKYVEPTLMSKNVGRRIHDSRRPLSPEALNMHESIIDRNGEFSESLAILPFVKTSPIWEELEALEIFSKMPQRPNFHLVQQYCPELREGMALGLMISFANLAESINRLDIKNDNGPFEQKLLDLSFLEANGFDVRDMRSRLETLLNTKNRCLELQDAMKKLEKKIAHKETEDRELGAQIHKLAMVVHDLELHAYLMRDIMRSAVSQKMNNAIEISRLRTEANKLERSYVSTTATQ